MTCMFVHAYSHMRHAQVCKAGLSSARRIWLTRHGESKFNVTGQLGGNAELSWLGEQYAMALPSELAKRVPLVGALQAP